THLDDAGVTTRTTLETLRQVNEHLLDEVDGDRALGRRRGAEATQEARNLALRSQTARPIGLAQLLPRRVRYSAQTTRARNQALCDTTQFLGLGFSGFDSLVQNEIRGQRAKHRFAVACVSP